MAPFRFRLQTPRHNASIALVGAQRTVIAIIVVAARVRVALTTTAATITLCTSGLSRVGLPAEREFARRRGHRFDGERAIVQRLPLGDTVRVNEQCARMDVAER